MGGPGLPACARACIRAQSPLLADTLASRHADGAAPGPDFPQAKRSENLFLEPFVRSMLLGLGSAVLLESGHTALEVRRCCRPGPLITSPGPAPAPARFLAGAA